MNSPGAGTESGHDVELILRMRQEYVPGESLAGFFGRLRREGVPYGRRCSRCSRVSCPPRDFCSRCMAPAGDWVPLGRSGEIRSLTIINAAFDGFRTPPFAVAFIQLDGADTATLNYLEGCDWSVERSWHELIGTRCNLLLRDELEGGWADFYFALEPRH